MNTKESQDHLSGNTSTDNAQKVITGSVGISPLYSCALLLVAIGLAFIDDRLPVFLQTYSGIPFKGYYSIIRYSGYTLMVFCTAYTLGISMVLLLCIGLLADKHDKRGGGLSWAVNGFGIAFIGTIGNVVYIGLHPLCINAVQSTATLAMMFLLLAIFTVLYSRHQHLRHQKQCTS